mmetsp:Transcript_65842/g.102792  ORF Transcript_65842/g.102792 Transcript_65842/m.102792 type:complete len:1073 (-) Transcript_65842:59-3277(-)|eukprot:CAMPEP_0169359492 /NCGR_PEP_ID=MMETSP1017-20121227/29252_1 /TAXON_ID=342587 /ORGANISM="Karlodinium micrum, Strain CCMP2283" /LENGTH=1072 /DNA_ID=CAMNT_0009456645 /DNA_START=27 /DNA_END=3245 /DNA_ORIENTATION=+
MWRALFVAPARRPLVAGRAASPSHQRHHANSIEGPITKLTNVKLVRGGAVIDSDLWFRSGRILGASKHSWTSGRVEMRADIIVDGKEALVVPGFIDLQLNGGFGVDFSSTDLKTSDVDRVAQGILAHGVTSFLPTVITSSADVYSKVLPKLAPRRGGEQGAEIIGVHCEGPFISRGKRGTHPEEFVQDSLPDKLNSVLSMYGPENVSNGTVRLVTLAPELEGASEAISGLVDAGVTVAMGHTAVATKEAQRAVQNGARLITHLFNAIVPFHHRDPGVIGLLSDGPVQKIHYGLIVDGIHVHPSVVNMAFRTHPAGCVLVTDAMSALGLGCGSHRLGNVNVIVEEAPSLEGSDMVLRAQKFGTDTLAGAVLDLHSCFKNLMAFTGCNVAAAADCASTNAADALGLKNKGRLEPGCDADFLLLDARSFDLRETWICGKRVWESAPGASIVVKETSQESASTMSPEQEEDIAARQEVGKGEFFVGIDLGGTTISVGVVDDKAALHGEIASGKFGVECSPRETADRIHSLTKAAVHSAGVNLQDVTGFGICSPGLVDAVNGIVISTSNLGWKNVPLRALVAESLGVDQSKVVLEHDASAALLAEVWAGAARGKRDVVMLTLGTGIGGAIMSDGHLLRGKDGAAGELGHMILVPDGREHGSSGVCGIFEGYASATAVAARAEESRIPPNSSLRNCSPITCLDVFREAERGDLYAAQVVRDTARYLALGCINVTRCLAPETILFAGGMALAGEQLFEETRAQYARYHWNVAPVNTEMRIAELGNSAGLIGAAYASYSAAAKHQSDAASDQVASAGSMHADGPRIHVFKEAAQISSVVASEIAALIRQKQASREKCVLGLATGSTPIQVYKELVRMHLEEGLSFAGVVTFNLDEYWPMSPDATQSYRHFMNTHLFNHVDIDISCTHVPDGTVSEEDVDSFCSKYERAICESGGIDIQILGLGRTGHIGFNEPGSSSDSRTRMVHLDPITRKDAAKDFGGEENVPTAAITMGVASILDARRILLMAFGEGKASIAARSFTGEISEDVTASFLQRHSNSTVYLDVGAAKDLNWSAPQIKLL